MEEGGRVFRGGVPYSIDVKRLMEAFPLSSLTEGRVIEHEELVKVVQLPKGSERYYTVINAWIMQMRASTRIFMTWRPGIGIEVLDPAGVLKFSETRIQQKFRQTGKAIRLLDCVDRERLNAAGQKRFDHDMRVTGIFEEARRRAKKNLPVDIGPIESRPKTKLIEENTNGNQKEGSDGDIRTEGDSDPGGGDRS